MEVEILKLDNLGRGICYLDNKITFVSNALPKERVLIKLVKETSKYNEAIVLEYLERSPFRKNPPCPYFNDCGGCHLMHMSIEETIKFKREKLLSLLKKYGDIDASSLLEFISSPKSLAYRNKITLKVSDYVFGYYKEGTHHLLKIENCLIADISIQKLFPYLKYIGVKNGEVTIRTNQNAELLLHIKTKDKIKPDFEKLKEVNKVIGIVLNDQTIYGEPYLIHEFNNQFFICSYDSFFQVNNDICLHLFNLLKEEIKETDTILDLYCGVGTLGIASSKNNKVYGIEIIQNAILNAIKNAKINHRENNYYSLGDVKKCLPKIKDKISTIIIDPPRAGLDSSTIKTIIEYLPSKIIYISCNPITLARDLKLLNNKYKLDSVIGLDMFPFTYHVECMCVLSLR